MNRNKLCAAFDALTPAPGQKDRMWEAIRAAKPAARPARRPFSRPAVRWTAAAAALLLLVGAGLWYRGAQMGYGNGIGPDFSADNGMAGGGMGDPENGLSSQAAGELADAPARLAAEGKVYTQWAAWMAELGLPQFAEESALGESVRIEAADDPSQAGQEARRYCPETYGESVLAVPYEEEGQETRWMLWLFENFEAYEQNGDVDGADYWAAYGVRSADGLRALELAGPGQTVASITDRALLERFYAEVARLVFSQAEFDRLMGWDAPSAPPQSAESGQEITGPVFGGDSPAYEGDPRFSEGFQLTVVFENGLRHSFSYFPRLPLFGRWTVSESFGALLGELAANADARGEAAESVGEPSGAPRAETLLLKAGDWFLSDGTAYVFAVYNFTEETIILSEPPRLEREDNGAWKPVERVDGEEFSPVTLEPGASERMTLELSEFAGLGPGRYRLRFGGEAAEFTIRNSSQSAETGGQQLGFFSTGPRHTAGRFWGSLEGGGACGRGQFPLTAAILLRSKALAAQGRGAGTRPLTGRLPNASLL